MVSRAHLVLAALAALAAAPTLAAEGDAAKPGRLKIPDDLTLELGVRLQPRLDVGDLATDREGTGYASTHDLYLRRARLSLQGRLLRELRFEITLEGDRAGQGDRGTDVSLLDANVSYAFADALVVAAGRQKLPYSRISLTSSGRQLLVERPLSSEAAKDLFGDYRQPSLQARGRLGGGVLAWYAALADGWSHGEFLDEAGGQLLVHRSDPMLAARLEVSPPGWTEARRSDAHLGTGRHVTLGVAVAAQRGIAYRQVVATEDRRLVEIDLSGHAGPFTAQAELNAWEIDSNAAGRAVVRPRGLYVQAGLLLGPVEPAIRVERFDADADAEDDATRVFTAGLNWYLREHDLKLQLAWQRARRDVAAPGRLANDDTEDVIQLQGQLDL
jgi:phosphate-selective porin OprO/OprP